MRVIENQDNDGWHVSFEQGGYGNREDHKQQQHAWAMKAMATSMSNNMTMMVISMRTKIEVTSTDEHHDDKHNCRVGKDDKDAHLNNGDEDKWHAEDV